MARLVKCIYCSIQFDRDKEETVQPNPNIYRYAHKACYDKSQASKSQAEKDYELLEMYIKDLFDIQVLNATITKQIKTFRENFDLTYSGILSTLKWWTEIKKEKMEDKNYGIAIVPYIYDQAKEYYYSMYKANQVNESLDLEHYKPKIEIVNIPPPSVHKDPPKLMEFWKESE